MIQFIHTRNTRAVKGYELLDSYFRSDGAITSIEECINHELP